jgi:D-alanyl-D-alanine carboxypeptidase (penicillin-binding protein 5/6)
VASAKGAAPVVARPSTPARAGQPGDAARPIAQSAKTATPAPPAEATQPITPRATAKAPSAPAKGTAPDAPASGNSPSSLAKGSAPARSAPAPVKDATADTTQVMALPPAPAKAVQPLSPAKPAPHADATQPIAPPAVEPKPEPKPNAQPDPEPKDEPKAKAATTTAPETAPEREEAPTPAPITLKLRLTKRRALLLALIVVLAALTSGATIQLRRTAPPPQLTVTVAQNIKILGSALKLPWPKAGSAEMMVEGLGRLGGVNGKKTAPIGSVAKVMTAYLILKNHPLAANDPGPVLTVSAADVEDYQSRIPSGQSLVKVATGERITERQALEALMLPSANNIAHMLGVWDAGSADAFIADMNDAAAELGMTGTKYTDPSGFLPSTVSTAADQVILARAALQDEVFADIIAEPTATIPVAGKIKNYNDMLGRDGVFGIKTGSTTEAGGNLVFASRLELDGQVLTIVGAVFNQPGEGTPAQLARVNKVVHKLLTSVQSAIHTYSIIPAQPVGKITTAWGEEATVSAASALKVIGWAGLSVPVKVTTSTPGASVRSGQTVGAAEARPGPSAVRVDLRTDRAVTAPSLWWRLTRKP